MPIYATPADLWAYEGKTDEPDEAFVTKTTPLLRRASSLVQRAIRAAIYAADASGFPVDVQKLAATKDATCEQAMTWDVNGIDPYAITKPTQVVASKGLGSASVSYQADPEATARLSALSSGDELTGEAWRSLDEAGLLSTNVQSGSRPAGVYPLAVEVDLFTGNTGNVYRSV